MKVSPPDATRLDRSELPRADRAFRPMTNTGWKERKKNTQGKMSQPAEIEREKKMMSS